MVIDNVTRSEKRKKNNEKLDRVVVESFMQKKKLVSVVSLFRTVFAFYLELYNI